MMETKLFYIRVVKMWIWAKTALFWTSGIAHCA